jgi:hypothetical protein
MPSTMDDGKHNNLIGHRVEVDRVREAPYQRTSYFTLDAGIRQGCLEDTAKRRLNLRGKGATEPRTLVLVPVTSVE